MHIQCLSDMLQKVEPHHVSLKKSTLEQHKVINAINTNHLDLT